MFKRTDSNPGQYSPTKSTIALAVTLLITLGLAQWYVSTKQGASNVKKLLSSIRESGLDQFIPFENYSQYYILYNNNDEPVGYKYYEHYWKDNYLMGIEITRLTDHKYYGINEWRISNNTNTWSQHERISDNGTPKALDITYNPDEGMKYIINGTIVDASSISFHANLIPPFMLDIYSSIGVQRYNTQLDFTLLAGIEVINFPVSPGELETIPSYVRSEHPDGYAVQANFRGMTQNIYYSKDHQLIYQKDNLDRDFDTIIASDKEDVFKLWPEAEFLLPKRDNSGDL